MSDKIDESNMTEYNSNAFTVLRLHRINERVQQCFSYKQPAFVLESLLDYYTEIEPKLEEYRKTDHIVRIKELLSKSKHFQNLPASVTITRLWLDSLRELYSEIHKGANVVGLGSRTKDNGRGAAQFG